MGALFGMGARAAAKAGLSAAAKAAGKMAMKGVAKAAGKFAMKGVAKVAAKNLAKAAARGALRHGKRLAISQAKQMPTMAVQGLVEYVKARRNRRQKQ